MGLKFWRRGRHAALFSPVDLKLNISALRSLLRELEGPRRESLGSWIVIAPLTSSVRIS